MNEDKLRIAVEKDIENGQGVCTMMNDKNVCVREYEMNSGRACRRVGIFEREERVGFISITTTIKLFSTDSGELFFTDIGQDEEEEEWIVWNG